MTDYRDTIGKSKDRQTGYIGESYVESGKDTLDKTISEGEDVVDSVVSEGEDVVGDTIDTVNEGGDDFTNAAGSLGESLQDFDPQQQIDDTVDTVEDTTSDVVTGASDVGSAIESFAPEGDIEGAVDSTIDSVQDTGEDIIEEGQDTVGETVSSVQESGEDIIEEGQDAVDTTISTVQDAGQSVIDEGEDVVDETSETIGEISDTAEDTIGDTADTITSAKETFDGFVTEGQDAVINHFQKSINQNVKEIGDVLEFLEGGVDIAGTIAGGAAEWVGDISGVPGEVAGDIGGVVGQAVGGVLASGSSQGPEGDWGEPEKIATYGRGAILRQSNSSGGVRFFAIGKDDNNNVIAIDSNGNGMQMRNADSMNQLPSHGSVGAAESAIEAAGLVNESSGSGSGESKEWGSMNEVGTTGRCVIMGQRASDGSKRFFTITENQDGEVVAMDKDGNGVVLESVDSVSKLPHYPTVADAESACPEESEDPADGGNKGDSDDSSGPQDDEQEWSDPTNVAEVGNCFINKQTDADRNTRYFTLTRNSNDEIVAVASNGGFTPVESVRKMGSLPHYPTLEDAKAACPESEGSPENGGEEGDTDDSSRDTDTKQGGIMSSDIMGIPVPVAAAGALAGAGGISMFLGDDSKKRNKRKRRTTSSSKNKGNKGRNSRSGSNGRKQ